MYSINFNEKNKIIIVTFAGIMDKNEPLNYIKSLISIKNLPENLRIMQDFTKAHYGFEISDLDDIANTAKNHAKEFKTIKVASIHNKSVETAFSIIFAKLLESKNLNYKVFSTFEVARKWLVD